MYGMVKVWTKGQIVIPKQAREDFDIKTWDEIFVMTWPRKHGMVFFKADTLEMMKKMVDSIATQVKEVKKNS